MPYSSIQFSSVYEHLCMYMILENIPHLPMPSQPLQTRHKPFLPWQLNLLPLKLHHSLTFHRSLLLKPLPGNHNAVIVIHPKPAVVKGPVVVLA